MTADVNADVNAVQVITLTFFGQVTLEFDIFIKTNVEVNIIRL